MTVFGDFELGITRSVDGRYTIQTRYDQPSGGPMPDPVSGEYIVDFDTEALARFGSGTHLTNTRQYGMALTRMLFSELEIWHAFVRARADATGSYRVLRFRLLLAADLSELQSLCWETLCDLETGTPLFCGDRILFSRMTVFDTQRPVVMNHRGEPRAVVAIARPQVDTEPGWDGERELQRAHDCLVAFRPTTVQPVTPERLQEAMEGQCNILFLVCDGFVREEAAWLRLEGETGEEEVIGFDDLLLNLAEVKSPPRLIILHSPTGWKGEDGHPLARYGAEPGAMGVPAVLILPGPFDSENLDRFLATLLHELHNDGMIDRAVSTARFEQLKGEDWWKPILFLRLKNGRLWPTAQKRIDMIGRMIGPYRLERELGRGGMGTVFLGVRSDDELNMKVSVKLLHREVASSRMLELFRRERQVLADLKHPHIATIHDAGTTVDGFPYFIMEYIEGQHIDIWCEEHRPSLRQILHLIRTSAIAIGSAHRAGVIHRDIKPHNLMITDDGLPKLLDFGIARMAGPEEDGHGDVPMTPAYASPEQRMGLAVSESTDIYALGLVLLELLTCRSPVHFETEPLDIVTQIVTGGRICRKVKTVEDNDHRSAALTVPRLTQTAPFEAGHTATRRPLKVSAPKTIDLYDTEREPVPEALGYVLRRTLALDPDQRYRSTDHLIAGLDRVLAALPRDTEVRAPVKKEYDAFFWNHPTDRVIVNSLIEYLREEEDLLIWQPQKGRPGRNSRALSSVLERSRACLICLGPDSKGGFATPLESRSRHA